MPVTLQVIKGPSMGRKVHVARGQVARIGRTEWADIPFPNDAGMADIHFVIHEDGPHCVLKDFSEGIGTLVNEVPVTEVQLHSGDKVTAGTTVFSIAIDGEAVPTVASRSAAADDQKDDTTPKIPLAIDYGRRLKLSDPAKELLTENLVPIAFINLLIEKELYPDALRFLAFVLPKPIAINWGCDCVEQVFPRTLTALEQRAFDAAKAWADDPSQTNCRAAESAATDTDYSGAPGWLALSAFWSGDSLAPVDLPPVPPDETLTAVALTGALAMATALGPPSQTNARYQDFLSTGRNLIPDTTAAP